MKKIVELKSERTQLIESMAGLIESGNSADWDAKDARVKEIDIELEKLERQENLNKSLVAKEKEEDKVAKRYDIFKAIRESAAGKLSGLELEMHQEAENEFKRAGQTINGLGIPSMVYSRAITPVTVAANGLAVQSSVGDMSIATYPVLLQKLGVTFYNDLTGKLVLPYTSQFTATFPGEATTVDGYNVANTGLSLEAKRVGGTNKFTKELLSQTSAAVQTRLIQDFMDAIWRAVQKKLFTNIAADTASILSAYEASDTTVFPSAAALNDIINGVVDDYAENVNLLTTKAIRGYMRSNVGVSGSGIPMWLPDNTVMGMGAYAHADATAASIIIGNWANAVVGQWGGMELIIDPYSSKNTGHIEITANGLFDAGSRNPNSFSVARNIKTA